MTDPWRLLERWDRYARDNGLNYLSVQMDTRRALQEREQGKYELTCAGCGRPFRSSVWSSHCDQCWEAPR